MRVFVQLRQAALSNIELIEKFFELKNEYDKQFSNVYEALDYLLKKIHKKKLKKSENELVINNKLDTETSSA